MSQLGYVPGLPGMRTPQTSTPRLIFKQIDVHTNLAQGKLIDGTKSRDPGNTGDIGVLRPGLLMGKITSGGLYAPSVIDKTAGALAVAGTTITLSTAGATELVRRQGASGTFTLTGPPTANATVRSLTVTYSAVVVGTGVVTLTSPSVNEVQTVNFNIASTGGSVVLQVPKANGVMITTTPISWNATDATYLAAINTALDTATGVTGGIVATAINAVDPDLGFVLTFSGTGYAGLPQPLVDVRTLPTSSTSYNVVRTTTGVDGRFVAGSFVGPTDGSQTPIAFISDDMPTGVLVLDTDLTTGITVQMPYLPVAGVLISSQLLPVWPTDTSLQAWIYSGLNTNGKFVRDDAY